LKLSGTITNYDEPISFLRNLVPFRAIPAA
jgi:hypothetical protein